MQRMMIPKKSGTNALQGSLLLSFIFMMVIYFMEIIYAFPEYIYEKRLFETCVVEA